MTAHTNQAAIYVRVSTSGQEDGSSLGVQLEACRDHAANRGWSIAAEFREVHTGADLHERPQLRALREMIRRGEADILLCYSVDRLSRRQAHVAIIADECERAGVAIHFVTEEFEQTAVGEFIRNAKAFAAEVEREKTKERTQSGLRARVASGKPVATAPPSFGLRWRAAAKSGYEVDPTTSPLVSRMFHECDRGLSLRRIARALENDGILPPRHNRTGSARWGVTTVRHILTERAYTGAGQAFRYKAKKGPHGRQTITLRPEEERVTLPAGTYPRIIDPALFERVQQRLSFNKRESMRSDRNPEIGILRRGYATCGSCGQRLVVVYERGTPVYRCHPQTRQRHGCPGASIRVSILDEAAWSKIAEVLADPATVTEQVKRLREDDPTAVDLTAIDRQIAGVMRKQANVAEAVAMLDGNPAALAPLVVQLETLSKQRQALERERVTVEVRREGWLSTQAQLASAEAYCRKVASALNTLSFAQKRLALEALAVNVQVFRADRDPRWVMTMAFPFDDEPHTEPGARNVFNSYGTTATCCATTGSPTAITSSN